MASQFQRDGDLPLTILQPSSYLSNRKCERRPRDKHRRNIYYYDHYNQISCAKRRPCYDWIFSGASNVHVATDRISFKTYTEFKTYVLTIGEHRRVPVKGIGTVELRIRCQPGSKDWHTTTLDNVLHVPSWLCNIFSDIHFMPLQAWEHEWGDLGVRFLRREGGVLRSWGFTESFRGLDKLVLAKTRQGRSPMLEDKDREIFSISVTWPQNEKDRWEAQLLSEQEEQREKAEREMESVAQKYDEMTIGDKSKAP